MMQTKRRGLSAPFLLAWDPCWSLPGRGGIAPVWLFPTLFPSTGYRGMARCWLGSSGLSRGQGEGFKSHLPPAEKPNWGLPDRWCSSKGGGDMDRYWPWASRLRQSPCQAFALSSPHLFHYTVYEVITNTILFF